MDSNDVCGINKLVERDIDMLVAEELRVSVAFCKWITGQFGQVSILDLPAICTNVSVVEDGSEADVVARGLNLVPNSVRRASSGDIAICGGALCARCSPMELADRSNCYLKRAILDRWVSARKPQELVDQQRSIARWRTGSGNPGVPFVSDLSISTF